MNRFSDPGELQPTNGSLVLARRQGPFTLLGSGMLIAAGYMDPGNWATALDGGARYGYRLLSVVVLASLLAMLLQWVAAKVGIATGRDLAQLCRMHLPRWSVIPLWLASEAAIVACDVAEVVGSAVALQMLLHVTLVWGVLLAAVLTIGLLLASRHHLGLVVTGFIGLVIVCLALQIFAAQPDWAAAAHGLVPDASLARDQGALWMSAGIVGATVMPHNLYLHSALVKDQARSTAALPDARRAIARVLSAVRTNIGLTLSIAMVVNVMLLVLSAALFHGKPAADVQDLAAAQRLLAPALHARWPGIVFALALLCCGLNSMVAGTLAGQTVMEGFLELRMSAPRRALLTRALALGPALFAVMAYGDRGTTRLLVASQVLLSLQLPLVMAPLLYFACTSKVMGPWRLRSSTALPACIGAALVAALNGALLWKWVIAP